MITAKRLPAFKLRCLSSLLFGVCWTLGCSFSKADSWNWIAGNVRLAVGMFFGSTVGFYVLLYMLLRYCTMSDGKNGKYKKFFGPSQAMVLILLCWMLHIVAFFPGAVTLDAVIQLAQFEGITALSNAHPIFSTWLMGVGLAVGRLFGVDRIGIFIFTFAMCVMGATLFSRIFGYLQKKSKVVGVIFLLFSAFFPLWPALFYTLLKDIPYSLAFSAMTLYVIEYLQAPDEFLKSTRKKFGLTMYSTLACLLRPNALPVVILLGVLFMLKEEVTHKRIVIAFIIPVVGWVAVNQGVISLLGIARVDSIDAYTILVQQTARYVRDFGNEVTPEQQQILSKVFNYTELADAYNPQISDYAKLQFKYTSTKDERREWIEVLQKFATDHPGCFVQAWINASYGYYYPNATVVGECGFYTNYFSLPSNETIVDNCFVDGGYLTSLVWLRNAEIAWSARLQHLPVIRCLFVPGTYFWLLVVSAIIYFGTNRRRMIIGLLPGFVCFAMATLTPINTHIRYALPGILVSLLGFANALCNYGEESVQFDMDNLRDNSKDEKCEDHDL